MGWKDWHILMALGSIAMNHRVRLQEPKSFGEMKEMMKIQLDTEEKEGSDEIPLSEFSKDEIEKNLYMTMGSTLKMIGLSLNSSVLQIEAMKKFLGKRYNYWDDDVEHDDYLSR
jgi:hypothetical protein